MGVVASDDQDRVDSLLWHMIIIKVQQIGPSVCSCILSMLAFAGYLRYETDKWEGTQPFATLLKPNFPKWIMETIQPLHVYSAF